MNHFYIYYCNHIILYIFKFITLIVSMKYIKQTEEEIIKYLRFRCFRPNTCKHTYMSYKNIANFLDKSVSYVQ